jgi:hypothetical protein
VLMELGGEGDMVGYVHASGDVSKNERRRRLTFESEHRYNDTGERLRAVSGRVDLLVAG